jgi:hypothetical protein
MKFQPQTLRSIQEFVNRTIKWWDETPADERERMNMINPDEPIVLSVPNPEWYEGEEGPYGDSDDGEPRHIYFHVESHGGGGDVDGDGNECGHDGASLTGMEIDGRNFLCTGRRLK